MSCVNMKPADVFIIYRVSVNFYIPAYIFRNYVVSKDLIFTFSVASTILNASDSYNYTANSHASIIGGCMHGKLEADRLCSARTIYALAWVVRGDQLCKHKWSGRTICDSINGPSGPYMPGPFVR